MKIRTIITQDAEVDDQNSLRHFLLYANEVELQGIVQTSSKFHWRGMEGAKRPEKPIKTDMDNDFEDLTAPFDKPYRWTGDTWMSEVIDDYEKDYPQLVKQDPSYPTPDYLRSITKHGNIGYEGEVAAPTEGSELIKKAILDDDPRTLYLQVWGGMNTIARALMDIEAECSSRADWKELHDKISKKIVITACGEQDPSYREHIADNWPDIQVVKCFQLFSYAYPWFVMPEGESKDSLRADFMKREILNQKSALISRNYCTWLDGNRYIGEAEDSQFGANPDIVNVWFGAKMGMPAPDKYDFLSEGDSPTYFGLFDWGFRNLESFANGGICGRYFKRTDDTNSKGQVLNMWEACKDIYIDREGKENEVESMWPYVADIQRDFAARIDWCQAGAKAEHAPKLSMENALDLTAKAGETISLKAKAENPDGGSVTVTYRVYKDASAACAAEAVLSADGAAAKLTIPASAKSGDKIYVNVKAQSDGKHKLVHYQQVIVTVR